MIGEGPLASLPRLTADWRPAVLGHLLALSRDDRYGRFASPLPDDGIAAYVGRIDFAEDPCFAAIGADGRIDGFIHLAVHGRVAELGASVLADRRRQGIARCLFRTALAHAGRAGIGEIHLATGHPVARRICAGLGHVLAEGKGYPRVRVLLF